MFDWERLVSCERYLVRGPSIAIFMISLQLFDVRYCETAKCITEYSKGSI